MSLDDAQKLDDIRKALREGKIKKANRFLASIHSHRLKHEMLTGVCRIGSAKMKKQNIYATLGLKALKRAAAKVAENARKNNLKIPVWVMEKSNLLNRKYPGRAKRTFQVQQGKD